MIYRWSANLTHPLGLMRSLQGPKKWFATKEGPRQEQAIFSGSVGLHICELLIFKAGGLGNLVTGLGSAKVGFLAYSMQNLTRNTIEVFVLMKDGPRVS